MKILFLEPYYGGSHKNFADGLISHSRHDFDLVTLPSRFWKWRMRGAALYFLNKIPKLNEYDGIITTDLMSVSDLKGISKSSCPPILAYFHENQLSYPLAPGETMDYQYGFTDITSALAASRVLFNSHTHKGAFFSCLPDFINRMPEYRPSWVIDEILLKTGVLYPGCDFSWNQDKFTDTRKQTEPSAPLIIWNHRWEFDKNPKDFFLALEKILNMGLEFRLALLGENFQNVPKEFIRAREKFENQMVQYGYVESRKAYQNLLSLGSIIISTAHQENFGLSVIEAIGHGCLPLLPKRLSYPEILPRKFHNDFLYKGQEDLIKKLANLIMNYSQYQNKQSELSETMGQYAWDRVIHHYDEELENLACGKTRIDLS